MQDLKTIFAKIQLDPKKTKTIVFVSVVIIIIILGIFYNPPRETTPQNVNTNQQTLIPDIEVVDINPSDVVTSVDRLYPIRLTFSQDIDPTTIRIEVEPPIRLSTKGYPQTPNIIDIIPERDSWLSDIEYTITVLEIKSKDKAHIIKEPKEIKFKLIIPKGLIVY